MKKHQVKTILQLQQYLGGMPYTEEDMNGYPYYIFQDGTLAIEDNDLAWIQANDDTEVFFNDLSYNLESELPFLDAVSHIKDLKELVESVLRPDDLLDRYDGFIHRDVYIAPEKGKTGSTSYIDLELELFVPPSEDSFFGDEILYVDMSDYMSKYTNNGLTFFWNGQNINNESNYTIQYILEEIEEISGENSEYKKIMCQFASILDSVAEFSGDADQVPKYYDKFFDKNNEPSHLMEEFLSDSWFQGLEFIMSLDDPVLQNWFIETYDGYSFYLSNNDVVYLYINTNKNEYREICDMLDKDRIIRDYIGVQIGDRWDRTNVKYDIYFSNDDFIDSAIDQAVETLQPFADNYPATLIFNLYDDSVLEYLDIDESLVLEDYHNELLKSPTNLLDNIFPEFLKWVEQEHLENIEEIGFFFVARP
jgi:hypothetical protein